MGNKVAHDFTVEEWDDCGQKVRDLIATCGNVTVAQAAFDCAVTLRPDRYILLRHGARVLAYSPTARQVEDRQWAGQ